MEQTLYMQVTGQTRRNRNRRLLLLASAVFLASPPLAVNALPTGGTVAAGSATISSAGTQTTVTQSSGSAVINWTGFNTASGETVQFNDPSSSSITLNRISGPATSFSGALNSNGNVWLINPQGIAFNGTSQVNVGGLLATTSNIATSDFMAGKYNFTPGGGPASATVSNAGTITVASAGLAALVAPNVSHTGTINAQAGTIALASGDTYTVDLAGDGLINLAASPAMLQQSINQQGTLNAAEGNVVITAAQATTVLDNVINIEGLGGTANNITISNQSGDLWWVSWTSPPPPARPAT